MNAILTTTLSILVISGMGWAIRKMLRAPVCPICLGVAGTWLWMVIGRSLGLEVDTAMLATLLGGSVVGIAYQLEGRLPPGRSVLLWKVVFIPCGLVAAYALAAAQWAPFAVTGVLLALIAALFILVPGAPGENSESVEELQRKMRECC